MWADGGGGRPGGGGFGSVDVSIEIHLYCCPTISIRIGYLLLSSFVFCGTEGGGGGGTLGRRGGAVVGRFTRERCLGIALVLSTLLRFSD